MDLLHTLATTGFAVAFLHAAIPTHWLPFVLTGKAQGWTRLRTMTVTAVAGGGHVLFTTVLGVLVAWFGIAVDRWTGQVFPYLAAAALIALGAYYLSRQASGSGHGHHHFGHRHTHHHGADRGHPHEDDHGHAFADASVPERLPSRRTDRVAITGLVLALTLSPCEGFLPVFLTGVRFGWIGFALLSATLALATLAGMLTFTWLTLAGLERFKLAVLERYEQGILGALLVVLGVIVMVFET